MSVVYPTADELTTFLGVVGLTLPSGFDADTEINAAIEWWEDVTGWHPFLADSAPSTQRYTPTAWGSRLILTTGFTSITDVTLGTDVDGTGGDSIVELEQWRSVYWREELQEGWITAIDFLGSQGTGWRSISVTGIRGCQSDLDTSVYKAILQRAALTSYGIVTGNLGRVQKIRQGPHEQTYETQKDANLGSLGSIVSGWDEYSQETAMKYVRRLV